MPIFKFRVVSVKPKRWWYRFRQAMTVILAIEHDDPNDWPLYGQINLDIKQPEYAAMFKPGQLYDMTLTKLK